MKKLSVWEKIKLMWEPTALRDATFFEAFIIGWFTVTVVLFPVMVLTEPGIAFTIAISVYYVARFPKTIQAVFGIKPNDKENK